MEKLRSRWIRRPAQLRKVEPSGRLPRLRLRQLSLDLCQLTLCLIESRLKRARIDLKQRLALLYVLLLNFHVSTTGGMGLVAALVWLEQPVHVVSIPTMANTNIASGFFTRRVGHLVPLPSTIEGQIPSMRLKDLFQERSGVCDEVSKYRHGCVNLVSWSDVASILLSNPL